MSLSTACRGLILSGHNKFHSQMTLVPTTQSLDLCNGFACHSLMIPTINFIWSLQYILTL